MIPVWLLRHSPIIDQPPGHDRHNPTSLIAVPSIHTGVGPNQLRVLDIQFPVIVSIANLLAIDFRIPVLYQMNQTLRDVTHLTLRSKKDAATVSKVSVGSVETEEIREVGNRDAKQCSGIVSTPDISQSLP